MYHRSYGGPLSPTRLKPTSLPDVFASRDNRLMDWTDVSQAARGTSKFALSEPGRSGPVAQPNSTVASSSTGGSNILRRDMNTPGDTVETSA